MTKLGENQVDMNQSNPSQSNPSQATAELGGRENLSAGVDGELTKEAMRFLLRRLDHDAALQQSWAHYNAARDSLRKQLPLMASPDFASRVMLAIDKESLPVSAGRSGWLRWSAGGAIAASVAAAALLVGQPTADVSRSAPIASHSASSLSTGASVASSKTEAPATVPSWLSGNSVGLLSQQASVTLGALPGEGQSPYDSQRISGYPSMHRYRTLNNNDGSYLLLLDPQQQPVSRYPAGQAAASAH